MSIASEIERLQNAKTSIKQAIENKGVVVGDGTLDTYAEKIDSIEMSKSDNNALIETTINSSMNPAYIVNKLIKTLPPISGIEYLTSLENMFAACFILKNIDLSNYSTSRVTNMSAMFNMCCEIEKLDCSSFDTSNVTDMSYMFKGCYKLTNITCDNFNTEKVTNMSYIFSETRAIETLNINNFDCSHVINIINMFYGMTSLKNFNFVNNLGKGFTSKNNNNNNYTLNLSASTELSYDSLIDVITKLYDLNLTYDVANGGTLYTQKLVLGDTNISKLSPDEIAIATNKGWVVS